MEDRRYTFIDDALSTYDFGTIQNLRMMLLTLKKNGISNDELDKYVELKSVSIVSNRPVGVVCEECGSSMRLDYLNTTAKSMTEDDTKVVYTCRNYNCMHQIFE